MKYGAILLAAGKGNRYKEVKQDVVFHGVPLWKFVHKTVSGVVNENRIVTVGKDIPGGETRTESVLNGLLALLEDTDRVVIVEAARPLVTTFRKRKSFGILCQTLSKYSYVQRWQIYQPGRII